MVTRNDAWTDDPATTIPPLAVNARPNSTSTVSGCTARSAKDSTVPASRVAIASITSWAWSKASTRPSAALSASALRGSGPDAVCGPSADRADLGT